MRASVRLLLAAALSGTALTCGKPALEPTVMQQSPPLSAPVGRPPALAAAPDATAPPPLLVVDLAIGMSRACVVVEDGRVGCFSTSAAGRRVDLEQRGRPWTDASDPPLTAVFVPGLPPAAALHVAVGSDHACVVLADASVGCWGSNARGELGTGAASEGPPPQAVAGLAHVTSLDLAWADSYAADEGGAAWSWGAGDNGVLGTGSDDDRRTPVKIAALHGVEQIASGGRHACALTREGEVLCWGANDNGALGTAAVRASPAPRAVAGVHHASAIGAGDQRTCALLADGRVSCWGVVGYVVSGAHVTTYVRGPNMPPYTASPDPNRFTVVWAATPSPVPGITGALALSSGGGVDCIRDSGGALCWSAGPHGPGPESLPPTRLPMLSVVRVVVGGEFACALDASGQVTCFAIVSGRLGPAQALHFEP
jgi:hypothetical protein